MQKYVIGIYCCHEYLLPEHADSSIAICMICIAALRMLDSYDAKIAKSCNLRTFWHVIQPINHLLFIF